MKKRPILLLGILLLGTPLVACAGTTFSSTQCAEEICVVTFSGENVETDIGEEGTEIRFIESDAESAQFEVNGEPSTCTEGETIASGGYDVTCTEVATDALTLEFVHTH